MTLLGGEVAMGGLFPGTHDRKRSQLLCRVRPSEKRDRVRMGGPFCQVAGRLQ